MTEPSEITGLANMISSLQSMIISLSEKVDRLERRLEQATIESDYSETDAVYLPVKRLVLGDGEERGYSDE